MLYFLEEKEFITDRYLDFTKTADTLDAPTIDSFKYYEINVSADYNINIICTIDYKNSFTYEITVFDYENIGKKTMYHPFFVENVNGLEKLKKLYYFMNKHNLYNFILFSSCFETNHLNIMSSKLLEFFEHVLKINVNEDIKQLLFKFSTKPYLCSLFQDVLNENKKYNKNNFNDYIMRSFIEIIYNTGFSRYFKNDKVEVE